MTPGGVGPWTHEYVPQGRAGEDCLYLNIWTPAADLRHRLPVLVWIPGGGFVAGSGSAAVYNGASLAAQGIVVVTINYRVGLFGFLVTPALAAEAAREHEPPGNYGLQDMIAAVAMGASQHRGLWRRSGCHHRRRPVGRRDGGARPDRLAARHGAVPACHCGERTA